MRFDSGQEAFPLMVITEQPLVEEVEWALPEFRADRVCAKCGHDQINTNYHDEVASYQPCYDAWSIRPDKYSNSFPEHFDRRCLRCSYSWCEAVLQE